MRYAAILKYRYEALRWEPSRLGTIANVLEFFCTKPRAENTPVTPEVSFNNFKNFMKEKTEKTSQWILKINS
jgi:hypothetical protein